MTFAIPRFSTGERVEVGHPKPSGPGLPPGMEWKPARFTHYDRWNNACVEYDDGTRAALSPEKLRKA